MASVLLYTNRAKKMPYSAKAVANFFLDLAKVKGELLKQMKLQKLVYFAHGWHLGLTGRPLLDEAIQAWSFGPVIMSLFKEFTDFGSHPITRKALSEATWPPTEPTIEDSNNEDKPFVKALLNRIWEVYGDFSDVQLSNMTHAPGTPWDTVNRFYGGRIPKYATIPDQLIEEFFKGQRRSNIQNE